MPRSAKIFDVAKAQGKPDEKPDRLLMSALDLSSMVNSGLTGMSFPHWNEPRDSEMIFGRISRRPGSSPTSSLHCVPVEAKTSTSP